MIRTIALLLVALLALLLAFGGVTNGVIDTDSEDGVVVQNDGADGDTITVTGEDGQDGADGDTVMIAGEDGEDGTAVTATGEDGEVATAVGGNGDDSQGR